jgi:hypothetical protein
VLLVNNFRSIDKITESVLSSEEISKNSSSDEEVFKITELNDISKCGDNPYL